MAAHYQLKAGDRVLDVGCGKGYQLVELQNVVPGLVVHGLDISEYALENAHESVKKSLFLGTAAALPFPDNYFDYVFSVNTLHNLYLHDLYDALKEIQRVSRREKYVCVESYRTEAEKCNLLYWQVTCESFLTESEWAWLFSKANYSGDYSFIYFE
jgi:protein-L-isoaspartate(D-aspartate) O-methyltransferase